MRLTWRCLAIGGCVVIGSLLVVWYMRVSTATAAPTTSTSVDQFTIYAPSDEPITPIPQPPPADPGKVSLGERLFRDTRMSHDNKWTCTACHDVGFNGALRDPRTQKTDVALHQLDTLTVFNSALSFRQSWEGNKRTLEEQIRASIAGKRMMRSTPDEVAGKLRLDPAMERDFRHAYGHEPDGASVVDSLVTYMRSLLTPGSRFDRWLQGDSRALSPQEVAGYQLFKSLGCVSCHQGVNIGGNLFQRHGIFHPLAAAEPVILRVPSLRNVAATPPYFHDGSAATLEVAVRKMGNAQLNSDLSDEQIASVVSFLRTLTGRYQGREIGTDP
jgi:cytochrome c peroxidase